MFNKIVIGFDGRDGGADAFVLARMLASNETELVLVHVYPFEHTPSRAVALDYDALLRDDAHKLLADAAPEDRAATLLAVGDFSPARALHHVAEDEGADLIVIGSCHRGAAGRVLLGDVSRSTLHGAPCPVAVAPRDYRQHAHRYETIGVGFNGTQASRVALELAAVAARDFGARLRVLSAAPTPAAFVPGYAYSYDLPDAREHLRLEAEQSMAEAIATLDVPAESEVIDDSPGAALEALSQHVGLLFAGSRGWGSAHRVVLGSTTDHLAHRAACPVIVVPMPEAAEARDDVASTERAHA